MKTEEKQFQNLQYVIRYLENFKSGKKYPVVILMHGAGTRGKDISKIYENPFFKITDKYKDFPFVTVAPLCHENTWFDLYESVMALTKNIYQSEFTDNKRFYAIGASMGGYAVWQMAMSCPEIFAAIVPICGGGMYWNAPRLKSVPIWAFHGDNDQTVFARESIKMIDAVKRTGGQAKLTIYENCRHDAWTETYSNPAVFKWLLSNVKENANIMSDSFKDPKLYG